MRFYHDLLKQKSSSLFCVLGLELNRLLVDAVHVSRLMSEYVGVLDGMLCPRLILCPPG